MQRTGCGLRGIILPRTRVNRASSDAPIFVEWHHRHQSERGGREVADARGSEVGRTRAGASRAGQAPPGGAGVVRLGAGPRRPRLRLGPRPSRPGRHARRDKQYKPVSPKQTGIFGGVWPPSSTTADLHGLTPPPHTSRSVPGRHSQCPKGRAFPTPMRRLLREAASSSAMRTFNLSSLPTRSPVPHVRARTPLRAARVGSDP
jgi:hypothetical protein